MKSRTETAILIISFIGIALSAYALSLHFAPLGSQFCNISETINCDKVNSSQWAMFFGIPVALGGLVAYFALFMLTIKRNRITRALDFTDYDFWMYIYIITAFMFSFQLYLTLVEVYLIHAYCIVCMASQLCTIALGALAANEFMKHK